MNSVQGSIDKISKDNTYKDMINIKSMHFNLNKDSLWLSYPLKTTSFKDLSKKIPVTHRLAKCKVFEEDKPDYRLFFNFFEVKTTFFSGNRLEIVTIANNILNNKPSFVILDCYSNVMSWDPISGIQEANCKIKSTITNTKYNVNLKYRNKEKKSNENNNKSNDNKSNDIFSLKSVKTKIKKKVLPEFSINPNYICYFKNFPKGYNLLFNKNQIDKKVILLKNINLEHNIYTNYIKELEHSFIYPQEMNFKVFL
jgi:hypothetical protein